MIEKVNPMHPDKIADRIAGALVDMAYMQNVNSKIAVEVLIGHGKCHIIAETDAVINKRAVVQSVNRISKQKLSVDLRVVKQDIHLSQNQDGQVRCGDNGIFKGVPLRPEAHELTRIARSIYAKYPTDGKYILDNKRLIICQSNATQNDINHFVPEDYKAEINPLGFWTGGTSVDSGATNRKLGSDMAESITGGGLHGKDLSKADVSVNIYAFLKAQQTGSVVELSCAIGDEHIDGKPYIDVVNIAREYINKIGGFEKFAEWGLF